MKATNVQIGISMQKSSFETVRPAIVVGPYFIKLINKYSKLD